MTLFITQSKKKKSSKGEDSHLIALPESDCTCTISRVGCKDNVSKPAGPIWAVLKPRSMERSILSDSGCHRWRNQYNIKFDPKCRGYWPAMARQGPVMVIQMPIVEQFRKMMGLEYF